jgi:hypothetical protein
VEPIKQPLQELTNVPISYPYIRRVHETLTAHGATFEETQEVDVDGEGAACKAFRISFPEGTVRVWGMTLARSTRFTVVFPDGFEQPGAELWPITRTADDRPVTILYLKKEGTHATSLA